MARSDLGSLLSTAEVARLLGLQGQTLRKWRLTGTGPPYIRLGSACGRVLYDRSDVEDWLSRRKFTSTSAESARR